MLHSSTVIQNKQALTLGSGWCIGDCSVTIWAKRCRTGAVETWRKVVSQRVHSHYRCHHAESQNCDKKKQFTKKGKQQLKWGSTACSMYIKAKRHMSCAVLKNYEHSTCLNYIKTGRTCVFLFMQPLFIQVVPLRLNVSFTGDTEFLSSCRERDYTNTTNVNMMRKRPFTAFFLAWNSFSFYLEL